MATGARQTNTFEEGLSRILNDIAALKRLPDAPMDWVIDFETTALDMWHKLGNETPTPNPMAGGAPMPAAPMPAPMQAPGSGAMPPSGMPQIDPAMQAALASGGDPMMGGQSTPLPDELARMLAPPA